jgi:hypothetical protein
VALNRVSQLTRWGRGDVAAGGQIDNVVLACGWNASEGKATSCLGRSIQLIMHEAGIALKRLVEMTCFCVLCIVLAAAVDSVALVFSATFTRP